MGNPAIQEYLEVKPSVVLRNETEKAIFPVRLTVVKQDVAAFHVPTLPQKTYTRQRSLPQRSYRDAVCDLTEKTVSLALTVPLAQLQARTRMTQEVALARQIAMYLCHTTFSLPLTEVGMHFHRDRTTVSHACNLVEDKRDQMSFDILICQLEALLNNALEAVEVSPYCDNDSLCACEGHDFALSNVERSIE